MAEQQGKISEQKKRHILYKQAPANLCIDGHDLHKYELLYITSISTTMIILHSKQTRVINALKSKQRDILVVILFQQK